MCDITIHIQWSSCVEPTVQQEILTKLNWSHPEWTIRESDLTIESESSSHIADIFVDKGELMLGFVNKVNISWFNRDHWLRLLERNIDMYKDINDNVVIV